MGKQGLAVCFIVVGELYSSWEIFLAPALLQANAMKMVQSVLDVPESLKDYPMGAPWGKCVVIKTFRSFIHVASSGHSGFFFLFQIKRKKKKSLLSYSRNQCQVPATSFLWGLDGDGVWKPLLGIWVTRVSVRRISKGFISTFPNTETVKLKARGCCIAETI